MVEPALEKVPTQVIDAIEEALGPSGCILDVDSMAAYLADRRGKFFAKTPVVARPANTEEVAAVMRICHQHGVGVVPQGGNTGLVGGSVPDDSGSQVLLSLERLRRIREIDPLNYSITVEAGCVLADVQSAADEAGLLFPLSLAAEGSCQIGGNLGTNAGGHPSLAVWKYSRLGLRTGSGARQWRGVGRSSPIEKRQHRVQP